MRCEDVSGVSGCGVVAEGVQFADGRCVMAWRGQYRSIAIYEGVDHVTAIHGHDGRMLVEWID